MRYTVFQDRFCKPTTPACAEPRCSLIKGVMADANGASGAIVAVSAARSALPTPDLAGVAQVDTQTHKIGALRGSRLLRRGAGKSWWRASACDGPQVSSRKAALGAGGEAGRSRRRARGLGTHVSWRPALPHSVKQAACCPSVAEVAPRAAANLPPAARCAGLIVPPPDIRAICDKTAQFVAKNGREFERRILANEAQNAKFNFLRWASARPADSAGLAGGAHVHTSGRCQAGGVHARQLGSAAGNGAAGCMHPVSWDQSARERAGVACPGLRNNAPIDAPQAGGPLQRLL